MRRRPSTGSTTWTWVVAGALALVVVSVGTAGWLAGPRGVRLSPGPNQLVDGDLARVAARDSPTIAVDPRNSQSLVVAGKLHQPDTGAFVPRSGDGGRTWSKADLNLPPRRSGPFEARAAFDGKGTLYLLFSTLGPGAGGSPSVPDGLWLETSVDAGATFSPPVKVADRLAYQARLAVDHRSGNVHVTWLQADDALETDGAPAPGLGPPPDPVLMASSRDGGATFSERAQVSDPRRRRVGAASPVVGPDGDVYVLYQDYGSDLTVPGGRPDEDPPGTFSLVMSRSTDGGATFSDAGVVDSEVVPSERFLAFMPSFASLAVDARDGALYVAWSDLRNGDADVFVRRSDDEGERWSSRVRVDNVDDSPRQQQYLPKLAVAPNGRVDVLFLDRDDRAEGAPTWALLSSSVDKGSTWHAVRVSDRAFDARVGPRQTPLGGDGSLADQGTDLGLESAADAVYAVWTDGRRGSLGAGGPDVFFAKVSVAPR